MSCDLCGADGPTKLVKIEGVAYRACSECAQYGEEVREVRAKKPRAPLRSHDQDVVVRPDIAIVLRNARERSGKNQEDFAKRLNMKFSDYHHWEAGHRVPTVEMARRLEKELGESLVTREERVVRPSSTGSLSDAGMTIGDVFKR